jgi:hypothetical protein
MWAAGIKKGTPSTSAALSVIIPITRAAREGTRSQTGVTEPHDGPLRDNGHASALGDDTQGDPLAGFGPRLLELVIGAAGAAPAGEGLPPDTTVQAIEVTYRDSPYYTHRHACFQLLINIAVRKLRSLLLTHVDNRFMHALDSSRKAGSISLPSSFACCVATAREPNWGKWTIKQMQGRDGAVQHTCKLADITVIMGCLFSLWCLKGEGVYKSGDGLWIL